MKKILLFLTLFITIGGYSQGVTVSPNAYSTNQLVRDVLVKNSCLAQISNISSYTGTNAGYANGNGISYFQNTNPDFPITSGILLSTGNVLAAQGPNNSEMSFSSPAWGGDADLETFINIQSKNATYLQFDFIAATDNFSVDFLFASEEYGAWQCESNDGFVFLLQDLTAGSPYQNMAVIPLTTLPVTVGNIRNDLYNSACSAENIQFFDSFDGGGAAATAPTNFEGRTVLMNASGALVPNHQYRIKIVIADDGRTTGTDGTYDSAVFFPEGSLNIGQNVFGEDLTVANGTALCNGETILLDTELTGPEYSFSWTRDTNPIPGGASITVGQPGIYQVTITRNGGCVTTQSIKVEYAQPIVPGIPNNLYACQDPSGTYQYDLSLNTPVIKQGLNPATQVTYHSSQSDAEIGLSDLPTSYTGPGNETIWARVKSFNSSCVAVISFQLLTSPAPDANQPGNMTLCESGEGLGTAVFDLASQNATVLGSQPVNENTILYFTSLTEAQLNGDFIDTPESYTGTNQTIYVRVHKNFDTDCYSITSFELIVNPLPVLPQPADVLECNSYTLPALANGNYYTQTGGNGTMLSAGDAVTSSQTIYIYEDNGTCANQKSFNVDIITSATAPADVVACENYTLPALPSGQFYYNGPGGTGGEIPAGTVITSNQTIYFYIPAAATCTQNNSFTVTITSTPVVSDPGDTFSCGPYTLPTLPNGQNYYTAPGGTGTQLAAGDVINTTQTLYIYISNPSNPACVAESSFTVTVSMVNVPNRADVVTCGSYTLPALSVGNYYTGSGGTGTQLSAGTAITTTQTIYIYAVSPVDASCFDEDSFLITINPRPELPGILPVTACTSYTLPNNLPANANYYTAASGGTLLPAGTVITTSRTVFAIATSPEGCTRTRSFTITIIDVDALSPGDQSVCDEYILPSLQFGNYYTAAGGTGTQLAPGTPITTDRTIYIYISSTDPICNAETSFDVTVTQTPVIPAPAAVVACGSYTLPALPVGDYYTGPNGTGTMLPPGTVINSSQNIRIYAANGTCSRQRTLSVTITDGNIAPADVSSCGGYLLPALPQGGMYYTQPAGGGTQINAGTIITTSQTLYTYIPVTTGANCTDNESFDITVLPTLVVDNVEDVLACTSYTLPALTNGDYYDAPGGGGNLVPAGTVIFTSQTLYVYKTIPGSLNCIAEDSFDITIEDVNVNDIPDQLVCDGFELPPLASGNYYTATQGGGTMLSAGDMITSDQTIYIYAATNTTPVCSDEESFTVTIKPDPLVDQLNNVGSCGNYTLQPLTNGSYYTGPGGTGTQLFAGQVISTTQDIYIYAETGGVPNCPAESMFTVFINPAPPTDVTECDSYTLPQLPVGQYYTGPAATGTQLMPGDVITTSQDIYVYVPLATVPNCTDNNKFRVTINNTPVITPLQSQTVCDFYALPPLPVGNYYTGPAGTGTLLNAGDLVTSTQTVYVFAQTGTIPNCTAEESFNVTVHVTPMVDARSKVTKCDSHTLDALLVGNYYALPGGPSTPGQVAYFPGDVITSSMMMYIYAESATNPDCKSESSFEIEILSITADAPADVTRCDSYVLPALSVGDYYTLSGGPSVPGQVLLNPGDVITATQTIYVYAELSGRLQCNDENPFLVTIYPTPVVDDTLTDFSVCDSYTLPALSVGNYYTAPNGGGTMLNAGDVITNTQTLYIYAASDPAGVCFDEHSYTVTVNSIDVGNFNDLYACESYELPVLSVGNYFTAPNGSGTQLPAGTIITTSQTIYVYGETNTTPNCTDEDSFIVTIVSKPVAAAPSPIAVCGQSGQGVFNLLPAMNQAVNGQANVIATVHETQDDAVFGHDAITNTGAYLNTNSYTQTLYIRVQSSLATDCYDTVPLQISVNDIPNAVEPQPLKVCDDDSDTFGIFDLTDVESEVLGTLNPTVHTVTFYDTEVNALAGTGVGLITGLSNYSSTGASVYIRVTNTNTNCFDVVELELIVNPLPVANAIAPYTLCDKNNPGDEREIFDLNSKIAEITGGADGVSVTFYNSNADALAGGPGVTNPGTYQNQSTVQTLFAKVTDEDTGCFRIVLMDIRVEPLPQININALTPDDVTVCDADGNGNGTFNLDDIADIIRGSSTGVVITFHETAENAEDGVDAITNTANYSNPTPFIQPLYIRVENTTGCVRTQGYSITLTVIPSPQLPDLDPMILCDEDPGNDQDGKTY
uniref:choice-of-anchor L domain-containing protein n=1 Tax=Flavobacterium sp. MK4S-17 TaxID=2543737 RepID=UPI0013572EE9